MKRGFAYVLACLCVNYAMAQPIASAPVIVETSGYYKVQLDEDLAAYCSPDCANIRIATGSGNIIPYIFDADRGHEGTSVFEEYKVVDRNTKEHCCTSIIFKSPASSINSVHLRVKNADVRKGLTMLGSDDLQHWFGLKDQIHLHSIDNPTDTDKMMRLDFPLTDYRFIKLTFNDSLSAPLNVESVGYLKYLNGSVEMRALEKFKVGISSKDKQTFIRIHPDTMQWIDQIRIEAKGGPLFFRNGSLYDVTYSKDKKGGTNEILKYLSTVVLTHENTARIDLPDNRTSELLLVIDDKDNPPLNYQAIQPMQLNRYLVAYFERDKQYSLEVHPANTARPDYDLGLFRDQIGDDIPSAKVGNITIRNEKAKASQPSTFFTPWMMWGAIVCVILLLAFLSVKMVRDINGSN